MRNPKTAFMARQERMMSERRKQDDTTQDSVNVRLAKLLGWRVEQRETVDYNRLGLLVDVSRYELVRPDGEYQHDTGFHVAQYRSEAAAWQHVPDCKHSVDATLATLPDWTHVELSPMPSADGSTLYNCILRTIRQTGAARGATRAEAAAHALEALLLARQAAQSRRRVNYDE